MHTPQLAARTRYTLLVLLLLAATAHARTLSADLAHQLDTAKYVYISSTRKDGSLSKPAEIWFLHHQGAVYVGTPQTAWRTKRIRAGRPQARIAVGAVDGPAFMATGEIITDAAVQRLLLDAYAKKYPDGWATYEKRFRDGFQDGSRVVIKYTPAAP